MALQTLQNFYKATVSTTWAAGTGNRYVSVLPTVSSGILVINPSDISKREIVSYTATGTDSGGNYITISARGVGGTTDQTHDVNEPVRMNLTAQHYADIQTELDLKLDDTQLDTDGTLAVNSDTKIASQKATKTYADAITTNVTTLNAQNVKLTGDQTISSGIKTFVVSPIVPTPTTSTQAASKGYADGLAIAGSPNSSTTVKGIGQVSVAPASPTTPIFVGDNDPRVPTQAENDALVGTGTPSSTNPYVTKNAIKFGGTGEDGALTISSGTTNIDLGGVQVFVKNYTSISITGTGALTFTNPHANGTTIILKSQGNVILSSSATALIETSGCGAAGGSRTIGGETSTGGRGGAGLYLEIVGSLIFTGTIKNNGLAGSRASAGAAQGVTYGGAKGSTLILANSIITNTGTSQCLNGADLPALGGGCGGAYSAVSGVDSYGINNSARGGLSATGTGLVIPWAVTSYSKTLQVVPSSGSSSASIAFCSGGVEARGVSGNVNIVALNTEFV
jgi:hypothetical protein